MAQYQDLASWKIGLPVMLFATLFGVPSGILFAIGLVTQIILLRSGKK